MEKTGINSYEIKTARTGDHVPVVNGVHLHSIYNPKKEAVNFVKKYEELLREKSNILVLGLGLGYHIKEIINFARQHHGDNFKIAVIEPNKKTYEYFKAYCKLEISDKNIQIYSEENIKKLYSDPTLISFLVNRPGVIAHTASFNLYKDFFKQYLGHQAQNSLEEISQIITDNTFKQYLENQIQNSDYNSFIKNKKDSKNDFDNDMDFFMLAYDHIANE